jgi:hypothetical protein
VLSAQVGPSQLAPSPKPAKTTGVKAPPYQFITSVAARPPGVKGPPSFANSVTVKSGDGVVFHAAVGGIDRSLPQKVTLTVQHGPSGTLTITASDKGATAHATVKSANGKPITLSAPRFTCSIPPATTFCPAMTLHANAQTYSLSFSVSAPILLALTTVVGGP